jgi:hypothetical protein
MTSERSRIFALLIGLTLVALISLGVASLLGDSGGERADRLDVAKLIAYVSIGAAIGAWVFCIVELAIRMLLRTSGAMAVRIDPMVWSALAGAGGGAEIFVADCCDTVTASRFLLYVYLGGYVALVVGCVGFATSPAGVRSTELTDRRGASGRRLASRRQLIFLALPLAATMLACWMSLPFVQMPVSDLVLWAWMGAVFGSLIGSLWVAVRWWRSSPCLADVARVVCPWVFGAAVGAAYVVSRWNPSSEWVLEEIPSLRLWVVVGLAAAATGFAALAITSLLRKTDMAGR